VIVVYPHTSNWDFVVGVLAKRAIGIPVTFWGKDSLFRVAVLGCGRRASTGRSCGGCCRPRASGAARRGGDPARDHEVLAARAAGCRGLRPESASPVRPLGP
jgi:hypothetical protein